MSVYNKNGNVLSAVYDMFGNQLAQCYDKSGNPLLDGGGGSEDYDSWETEYQHTILQARDAWKTEYRSDNSIIPLIIHTDQHRYLNSAHKPTFDYLSRAIKWSEVTAIVGLGDVCGAVYNTTDLNNMLTCLSGLPTAKKINVWGNHDCQNNKAEGSSYAYAPLTDAQYHALQDDYFDNSGFGGNSSNVRYGYKGMEYVIDPLHNVKICIFAVWVTRGDPWYHYYCDSASIEAMISMLSSVDDMDIIILCHIQPYGRKTTWYTPPVDGGEGGSGQPAAVSSLGYSVALDQLFADRKAKTSGTITDCDGVSHSYDFSGCTSDLLCSLSGHVHADRYVYSPDGTVPAVIFDAYRYDNNPLYFVNIDRTRERINVWKFDTANSIYNYQVPFEEVTT